MPDHGLDQEPAGSHNAQQSGNQEHTWDTEPADSQGAGEAADRGGEPVSYTHLTLPTTPYV